jgi:hypothetical protein
VIVFVPRPAVIMPPDEILQVYPVMDACVVYILPVEVTHTGVGPEIVGTGNAFTVTAYVVGVIAGHPNEFK